MSKLEVPRLQIVWTKESDGYIATYEMVLYEGKESLKDVRANDKEGNPSEGVVSVEMGATKCSGCRVPYDGKTLTTPFRDGVHIMRDSIRLGNIPMYVVYGDEVQQIENTLVEVDGQTVHKSLID